MFVSVKNEKKEKKKSYKHKREELRSFTGNCQELNSCLKMKITLKNDILFAKSSLGQRNVPLKSEGKFSMVRESNESVKYEFLHNNEFDLIVYFGATPFYFEMIELAKPAKININDYIGEYFSDELSVTYKIIKKKEKLFLSYPNNPKVELFS